MNPVPFISGLVAGILLSSIMDFPLRQYLPSLLVPGWQAFPVVNAPVIYLGPGVLLLVAAGAVSGRWGGTRSRLVATAAGAIAGLIAAAIVWVWAGGAAAGVWGSRPLIIHGIHPAVDEKTYLQVIANTTISIIYWSYVAGWASLLVGAVLGALGGLIAGAGGKQPKSRPLLWPTLTIIAALFSMLITLVAAAVFSLMQGNLEKVVAQTGTSLAYSAWFSYGLPVGSTLLMLCLWMAVGWFALNAALPETNSDIHNLVVSAYLLAVIPVILILCLLIMNLAIFTNIFFLCLLVTLLAISVILFKWARAMNKTPKPADEVRMPDPLYLAWIIPLSAFILTFTGYFGVTAPSLSVVLILIPAIAPLSNQYTGKIPSSSELITNIQMNYITHAGQTLNIFWGFLIGMLITGMLLWLIQMWWAKRKMAKLAQ